MFLLNNTVGHSSEQALNGLISPCTHHHPTPSHALWQQWLQETLVESHFETLRSFLPQLFIKPHAEASKSEI